jgi:hypothetical protein
MLDRDLAEFYGVPVHRLNEQVKRNIDRFPPDFYFQLTKDEFEHLNLISQIATSSAKNAENELKTPFLISQFAISNAENTENEPEGPILRSQIATSKAENAPNESETPFLKSQIVTSNVRDGRGGIRKMPYAWGRA